MMPLNSKAKKVLKSFKEQYGDKDGESAFYATANKQGRKPETWEKDASLIEKLSKAKKLKRCWEGYEPVPGKKPYSEDSCRKKASVLYQLLSSRK